MKDYLTVVDANFQSGARAAMADAKKVSFKPVEYVVDTHHRGDHPVAVTVTPTTAAPDGSVTRLRIPAPE